MADRFEVIKKKLNINGALIYSLSLAWVFWIIHQTGDKERLVYIMNAFLFGNIISLSVLYGKYIWYTISSPTTWSQARQFALSTSLLWIAMGVVISGSIWRHSMAGYNINSTNALDLLARYLAIIAATMQVFTPSQGPAVFATTERKLLVWGSAAGLAVALATTAMQSQNLLDWTAYGR